jgi:hypothetical protein
MQPNESKERERVGAQAVYIKTSLLSKRVKEQREPKMVPSFKRAHEIEKWKATKFQG